MKQKAIIAVSLLVLFFNSFVYAGDPSQTIVTLDLSQDLVIFIKFAIGFAGIFIVLIAGIGVAFFGFDVRKAKSSIDEMTKELKGLITDANKDHKKLKSLQKDLSQLKSIFEETVFDAERKIEELGAQIEEYAVDQSAKPNPLEETEGVAQNKRSEDELIRDIIKNSSFNWTTIGRLRKKTGLTSEQVLEKTRTMKDVEISTGKKSRDHIFRLAESS